MTKTEAEGAACAMTPEEETFFRETKVPVRLAAAAYSASKSLHKHRILDGSQEAKAMVTKVLAEFNPSNVEDDGLENWMLDIRVHVGIIPVELPSSGAADADLPPELAWDLVFIYRGTQPYSVTNWVTDFTFVQEPVDEYILQHHDPKAQSRMLVHRGFLRAFKGVHPRAAKPANKLESEAGLCGELHTCLQELKKSIHQEFETSHNGPPATGGRVVATAYPRSRSLKAGSPKHERGHGYMARLARALSDRPRRIVCTGHSLGGALATLGAAWCRTTLCQDAAFKGCDVQCVTIGSPRVGNMEFARAWDTLLRGGNWRGEGKSYRIVNALDVVPSVPLSVPFFRFEHVGVPVYLQRVVEDWTVKIVALLDRDRPWLNSGSAIDHLQWHYTAAMDAAEATAAQTPADRKKELVREPSWWFLLFAEQLKLSFVWDVFKRMLNLDLSLLAHFILLILSWSTTVGAFILMQSASWLGLLPIILFLLPALSASFVFQCVLQAFLLPFHMVFGFDRPRVRYKIGNLSLALLSAVVMVITYVSAWLGL